MLLLGSNPLHIVFNSFEKYNLWQFMSISLVKLIDKLEVLCRLIYSVILWLNCPWKEYRILRWLNKHVSFTCLTLNLQRTSSEVLNVLGQLIKMLQTGRSSLLIPRKKTIDELLSSRNMVSTGPADDHTCARILLSFSELY